MLKKLLVIALSVVALAAAGCGGGDKQAQTTIKVGATAGPHHPQKEPETATFSGLPSPTGYLRSD